VFEGQARTKAADLANHHTCRLGRWYDTVTDDRILRHELFRALAAHWRGDRAAADEARGRMTAASHEVVDLLERLARSMEC
jgi:methyl-accepting chemotaxis protein